MQRVLGRSGSILQFRRESQAKDSLERCSTSGDDVRGAPGPVDVGLCKQGEGGPKDCAWLMSK